MNRPDIRVAVYGDVNLNLIDGSAIWVQSITETLSRAGCTVEVLLKSPVETTRLTDFIAGLPNTRVTDPFTSRSLFVDHLRGALSPRNAFEILAGEDDRKPFDLVVLRGFRVVNEFVSHERFAGRLWAYLTDVPQSLSTMTPSVESDLRGIATSTDAILCQTEELRTFLESAIPETAGHCVLFPPVVPDVHDVPATAPPTRDDVQLVYTGKFAPRWNVLEMTRFPQALRARGVTATLHVAGDKFHDDPDDPSYKSRMRDALKSPGTVWHGGTSRQEAMAIAGKADIGLGWRDPALDASLELSTKVLEFGSLRTPVILNRTRAHEDLLGSDYPLYANSEEQALDAIEKAASNPNLWTTAADRCQEAAASYSLSRATTRITSYLDRLHPRGTTRPRLKVLVASHDLKFFTGILKHLQARPDLDVRVDEWQSLSTHDESESRRLLGWADVIICEWCGPNAVWYSQHKSPSQRLIIRLHRFELNAGYGKQVDIDAVDQVVCVSRYYADLTVQQLGWPTAKVGVIPNWVDVLQLNRPKYDGARHHLGVIGAGERRKRLDLALDVLTRVRREDSRFRLFVKTRMPWEYWWIWKKPEEQAHLQAVMKRIQHDPVLRGSVTFDGFGPDVGAWLRKIGWVLSTSDDESFHLAPAEGMASGALPVIRSWPGAETIYDRQWVHETTEEMAKTILDGAAVETTWQERGQQVIDRVTSALDVAVVNAAWVDVLRDGLIPVDKIRNHPIVAAI